MSQDPRILAEARALMGYIRATRDPDEQNRLWNRYYHLSDTVFPEAAALRQRYQSLSGEARQRFKREYMELVRRLWLATEPEAAYPQPLGGAPATRPPAASRRRKRLSARTLAAVLVVVLLAGGGLAAWQMANSPAANPGPDTVARSRGEAAPPTPPATDRVVEETTAPVAPQPVSEPAPDRDRETSADTPPVLAVPVAEIEARVAEEILPDFTPVPASLAGRGDRVVADDTTYRDVYVIESDSMYYVRIPGTGSVESVAKDGTGLEISEDTAGRAALLALWRENRAAIARADRARQKEVKARVAARRRANERQMEARKAAQEAERWRVKEAEWRAMTPAQRHGARVRAYSDWQAIQADAETLEELYTNIARGYEMLGLADSHMAELNRTYRRLAPSIGPDPEIEGALLMYGWDREELLRRLAEWEAEYYRMLGYVEEHYPAYEARIAELKRLDAALPEEIRLAEAAGNWDGGNGPEGRPRIGISFGTGFIVAKEHVMTCAHVVGDSARIRVTSSRGTTHEARVVAKDAANDWCLLAVDGLSGEPIPMAPGTPSVGATIYCLGYPLGGVQDSDDPIAGGGNVAALKRIDGDDRFLQITAPINPGNSGGPVLDQQGRWVGIVSQKLSDLATLQHSQTVAQGLNFAVKATHIQPLLRASGGVPIARAGRATRDPISLERITKDLSPSIVKIHAE